ncbi:hypothetical protein ACHAWF_012512 [Thalassiosira exigua]
MYSILILLLVATSAVLADKAYEAHDEVKAQDDECKNPSSQDGQCTSDQATSVYVIGDLHGDVLCAVSWVNRTGLIENLFEEDSSSPGGGAVPLHERLANPSRWRWTSDEAKLVFMGDYVDKGPTSKQTVEFVKDLTTAFPDKVTAILGNHELELLRDRDVNAPHDRYSAYSYAVVHPGEYHNYFKPKPKDVRANEGSSIRPEARALDEQDDLVLDLLYEAGMEVYAHNAHSAVRFVPSLPEHADAHRKRGIQFAITDLVPPQHRLLVRERLAEYQDAYLDAFRSGSALGDWMERRPIMHLAEDIKTLFVHGGVSHAIGKSHLSGGKDYVDKLNSVWYEHSGEGKLDDFLHGKGMSANDLMGYVVYELLTYRGNHPGYSKWESQGTYEDHPTDDEEVCKTLRDMLGRMEGIDRIAVGHTPEFEIRRYCDGAFLALDSTLGRWIRGSGNEYCPGPEHFENRAGVDVPKTSRDGKYQCVEIKKVCEGQIVRLDSDGSLNVLTM